MKGKVWAPDATCGQTSSGDARFVTEHHNVVLIGEVGTGKTHLAIALGLAACQREHRVRFFTTAELANVLVEAKAQGRLSKKLEQLARYELVVLDELGYVPFDKLGADLLFSFVSRVYERRSLVVTTNLPFARWSEVFLDATAAAAVIDRIVHHATILKTEGESSRTSRTPHDESFLCAMRASCGRADLGLAPCWFRRRPCEKGGSARGTSLRQGASRRRRGAVAL